jgi:hypothetical protein
MQLSQITFYVISSFLNFRDVVVFGSANKELNEKSQLAKSLLSKREAKRLFSPDLTSFW